MTDLSPIAKKIKEAYNAGFVDAIRERQGEALHHPSDEGYAHLKAEELYISDEELLDMMLKEAAHVELAKHQAVGGMKLRDRLLKPKSEE